MRVAENQGQRETGWFGEWPMLLAVLGLMIVGVCYIYSASHTGQGVSTAAEDVSATQVSLGQWLRQDHIKQGLGYLIGIGFILGLSLVDYKLLARWSMVAYGGSILLLLLVPLVGIEVYGAKRWLSVGPINAQPSELAKLSFILALANFLSRPEAELKQSQTFFRAIGLTSVPFVLILLEPDLGSSLVFLPVALVMMFYAGIRTRYLKRIVLGGGGIVLFVVLNVVYAPPDWRIPFQEYQRYRLLVFFNRPFTADLPSDASEAEVKRMERLERDKRYNIDQALISVGSGGVTGKGFGEGPQNALGYLPRAVKHNDFIFSVIGEEGGFIVSGFVVCCYGVILVSGIRIAGQARDQLGQLIAVGVVSLLFVHVFINIGMNVRIMPVTGLPLPLLSAGGSSAVCSMIAIGLIHNVYLNRRNY